MSDSASQFRTFQNVRAYESALGRHAQSVLWTRGITCPCISNDTQQADLDCVVCRSRGIIYRSPGPQKVYNELVKHDRSGRVFPRYAPIVVENGFSVRVPSRDGTGGTAKIPVTISVVDGKQRINIDPPNIPPEFDVVYMDYSFNPTKKVENGGGVVLDETNGVINIQVPVRTLYGKQIEGRLLEVSAIRFDSDDENVPEQTLDLATNVERFEAGYLIDHDNVKIETPSQLTDAIALATTNDADYRIEVDYTYTEPFQFLISNISERQRYTSPYITKEADASLTVPSWVRISPNDLFTVLAAEQISDEVLRPRARRNDIIRGAWDVVRVLEIQDMNGNSYPETAVEIQGRNELKWLVEKPNVPYSVQFLYNPTYVAIESYPSLRTAENKQFPQKINLKKWTRTSESQRTH